MIRDFLKEDVICICCCYGGINYFALLEYCLLYWYIWNIFHSKRCIFSPALAVFWLVRDFLHYCLMQTCLLGTWAFFVYFNKCYLILAVTDELCPRYTLFFFPFSPVYLWMFWVYLAALFSQMPPKRDEAALQEEEELQLAIALSQSEAEEKERMVRPVCSPSFCMPYIFTK